MKSRSFCVLALAVLAVLGLTSSVSATTIYDDFGGTSLDTSKWTATSTNGTLSFGNSDVTVAAPGGPEEIATSPHQYWGINNIVEFRLGASGTNNTGYNIFGLYDSSAVGGAPHIQIGSWSASWKLEVSDGTTTNSYALGFVPAAGDRYAITWTPSSVTLSKNGSVIVTDTTAVPGAGVSMYAQMFAMAGGSTSFDYVASSPVPEPSTAALALAGFLGLLAYAWRKRK